MAEGSAIIESSAGSSSTRRLIGHVTASCYSPNLERSISLGLLKNGRARQGEVVTVSGLERTVEATVTRPVFVDPAGERMRG